MNSDRIIGLKYTCPQCGTSIVIAIKEDIFETKSYHCSNCPDWVMFREIIRASDRIVSKEAYNRLIDYDNAQLSKHTTGG